MSKRRDDEGARGPGSGAPDGPTDDAAIDPAIEDLVRSLPTIRPPVGWEERVFEKIDAERRPRSLARALSRPAAAASIAVAMAAVWLVAIRGPSVAPTAATAPRIDVEIVPGPVAHRGAGAAVGDALAVHAGGLGLVELRVYREAGAAVARCPGAAGCRRDADGSIRASVRLTAPGAVRAVAFFDHAPPALGATVDDDVAAATRGGGRVVTAAPIEVH